MTQPRIPSDWQGPAHADSGGSGLPPVSSSCLEVPAGADAWLGRDALGVRPALAIGTPSSGPGSSGSDRTPSASPRTTPYLISSEEEADKPTAAQGRATLTEVNC